MGIHIERKGNYANKQTQYRYVTVAIVSSECLNNCVLIFYGTDLLGIYHNL